MKNPYYNQSTCKVMNKNKSIEADFIYMYICKQLYKITKVLMSFMITSLKPNNEINKKLVKPIFKKISLIK